MVLCEVQGQVVPVKMWIPVNEVESKAIDQLRNVASLPWAYKHVAVMPDVHVGRGCTIGSVIALKDAVAPAAVGVDIGCGMAAVKTSLDLRKVMKKLKQVRSAIEQAIPVGKNRHSEPPDVAFKGDLGHECAALFEEFRNLDSRVQDLFGRASRQIGTLGGGNHFIELCKDTEDNVWLMLHSGSRNIGLQLAQIHMATARKLAHNQKLPDKDLSVFLAGTEEMKAYRRDLYWAQWYASVNRKVMLALYMDVLREFWPGVTFERPVSCHHNYVEEEVHYGEKVFVTRKGAIRASQGTLGIIPGSMGAKSFIVRGKGNPEAFESASHGAGRKMSRGDAKKAFTRKDVMEQTRGVECRKDKDVIDEIPGAYKDIDKVMSYQEDLVEIVAELKQLICVKG